MLGSKERNMVYGLERQMLEEVSKNLKLLRHINPEYANRIFQVFSYPHNQGNKSYVNKIKRNSETLGIPLHLKENLYNFWNHHIAKNIRSASNMPNVSAIFITNPIKERMEQQEYQRVINMTWVKDIDGQSTENKNTIHNINIPLQWHIIHPTALSVLHLTQKTLDTKDLTDKNILVAGKSGNFWSMIVALLERAWAKTIDFNPREFEDESENKLNLHRKIREENPDAMISVIRWPKYFKKEDLIEFSWPIIDVTTEDDGFGHTVWSVDIHDCQDMENTYIPSINGGVWTITNAALMNNFIICVINHEIEKWIDPKKFEDLQDIRSYENFWLNREILA